MFVKKIMKWIDANTGIELKPGSAFENIIGYIEVLNLFEFPIPTMIYRKNGEVKETNAFTVRYMHPSFLFQKVAFWET